MDFTITIDGVLCDYRTRKPILTVDSVANIAIDSVVKANINVMDSSAPKPPSPREAYILSLGAPKQYESVLTREYRERNQRAALGGLMAYIPDTGEGSPEN